MWRSLAGWIVRHRTVDVVAWQSERPFNTRGFRQPRGGLWSYEFPPLQTPIPNVPHFRVNWALVGAAVVWIVAGYLFPWVWAAGALPLIGMAQQALPYGDVANDPDTAHDINNREAWKRTGEMFSDLYALQSRFVSAGDVRFANQPTTEAKISAARAQAAIELATVVFIPAVMIPFDPTAVDFTNTGIRNVREGGRVDVYDVRAYGAAGNNVTDDSNAIQAANNAAEANVGTVFFDDGTYRAKELTINTSGIRWVGAPNAELKFTATGIGAGSALLRVNTISPSTTPIADVVIESLGFNGNDQQINAKGIYAQNTQRLSIQRCRFRKFQGSAFPQPSYCIYATGYSASQPSSPYAWGATSPAGWSVGTRIQLCTFTDCGASSTHTAESIFLYYHDGALIQNNYAQNTGKLAFVDGWCRRVSIIGNEIEDQFDSGIRVQGDDSLSGTRAEDCQDCTISGNVIRNCVKDGIRYSAARGTIIGNVIERTLIGGIGAVVAQDTIIANNQCLDCANVGIDLVRTTVTGWGAHSHVTIANNECRGNGSFGIRVQGGGDASDTACTGITVQGNRCGRNGNDGIRITDCDDTTMVVDNTSYENGDGVITAPAGIRVEATLVNCGGVRIARNRCYEKRTGGNQRQGYGLWLLGNTGKTLSTCYVEFNDFSDHLDITVPAGGSGRAIRTTGGGGTTAGQYLRGNRYRNTNGSVTSAGVGSWLQSTDLIIQEDEGGVVGYTTGSATYALQKMLSGAESTGAGSATLGANCPANTVGAPYKWIKMLTSDGSVVYVPAWK